MKRCGATFGSDGPRDLHPLPFFYFHNLNHVSVYDRGDQPLTTVLLSWANYPVGLLTLMYLRGRLRAVHTRFTSYMPYKKHIYWLKIT